MVVLREKWLYSGKEFVFGQSGCIWHKVVEFVQKWLYSGKTGCIQTKVVVLRQSSCTQAKVIDMGKGLFISLK